MPRHRIPKTPRGPIEVVIPLDNVDVASIPTRLMNHLFPSEVDESEMSRNPSNGIQTSGVVTRSTSSMDRSDATEEVPQATDPSSSAGLLLSQCAAVIDRTTDLTRSVKQEIDDESVGEHSYCIKYPNNNSSADQNGAGTSHSRKRRNEDHNAAEENVKREYDLSIIRELNLPDRALIEENMRVQREMITAMHDLTAALKRNEASLNKAYERREYIRRQSQIRVNTQDPYRPMSLDSPHTPTKGHAGRPRVPPGQTGTYTKRCDAEPMRIHAPNGEKVNLSEISDDDLSITLSVVRNNPIERVFWDNEDITDRILELDIFKIFREPEKVGRHVIDHMFYESFMYDKYVPGIHRLRKFAVEFAANIEDAGRKFSGGEAIDDDYAVLFYDIIHKLGASALDLPSRKIYMTKAKAGIDSRRRESFQRKEGKAIAWKYYGPPDGNVLFPNERGNHQIIKPWLVKQKPQQTQYWNGVVNYTC